MWKFPIRICKTFKTTTTAFFIHLFGACSQAKPTLFLSHWNLIWKQMDGKNMRFYTYVCERTQTHTAFLMLLIGLKIEKRVNSPDNKLFIRIKNNKNKHSAVDDAFLLICFACDYRVHFLSRQWPTKLTDNFMNVKKFRLFIFLLLDITIIYNYIVYYYKNCTAQYSKFCSLIVHKSRIK